MTQIIGWLGAPMVCPPNPMRVGEFMNNLSRSLNVMQWKHRLRTRAGMADAAVNALQPERMALTHEAISQCPFA